MRIRHQLIEYDPPMESSIHDWRIIMRPGWGSELPGNIYGRVLGVAWKHLKLTGLCGKAASEYYDLTKSVH